jgi:beta propeller repeat protein
MSRRFVFVVAFLALSLLCVAAVPALAAPVCVKGTKTQICGTETRITTNPRDQFDPAISGNIIVYTDTRGADLDVWYYDLTTGEEYPVTTAVGDQQLPDVSNGYIVYADTTRGQVLLYSVKDEDVR